MKNSPFWLLVLSAIFAMTSTGALAEDRLFCVVTSEAMGQANTEAKGSSEFHGTVISGPRSEQASFWLRLKGWNIEANLIRGKDGNSNRLVIFAISTSTGQLFTSSITSLGPFLEGSLSFPRDQTDLQGEVKCLVDNGKNSYRNEMFNLRRKLPVVPR